MLCLHVHHHHHHHHHNNNNNNNNNNKKKKKKNNNNNNKATIVVRCVIAHSFQISLLDPVTFLDQSFHLPFFIILIISDIFDKHMELKFGTTIGLEEIHKTALLGMTRLLRNVCPER